MKFAKRRATDAPDPDEPADEAAPPPKPPRGSPVAAYAGIPDGQTLWLAVNAVAGSLAFRPEGGGDVIAVRSDLAEDQPAYRSIRVDLDQLAGDEPASYDVVVAPPGGRSPRQVWTHPLPAPGPVTIPPARDGRTQYALHRTDDGFLQVRRRVLEPAAELRQIGLLDWGGLELTLSPVADVEPTLLLLDQESRKVVATRPLDSTDAGWNAVITLHGLPIGSGGDLRVGVGDPNAWVPVRRRHNDLAKPNGAVLLPSLYGEETERPRLRPRWTPDGLLQLRLPKAGAPGAGSEDDPT